MSEGEAPGATSTEETQPSADDRATLILSLGSTQAFLAQARRTQDLWMGSFLTSYLAYRALTPILRNGRCEVVVPRIANQPLHDVETAIGDDGHVSVPLDELVVANLPNIFTALVPAAELPGIAEDARDAAHDALLEIGTRVFEVLQRHNAVKKDQRAVWKNQLEAAFDGMGVFWGACEWRSGSAGASAEGMEAFLGREVPKGPYSRATSAAARAHVVRKNLRDFAQRAPSDSGPRGFEKCTQCGLRLQVPPTFEDLGELGGNSGDGGKVKLVGRIRRGDRLCAVCLTKRLAWEHYLLPRFSNHLDESYSPDHHLLFPSTSSIAAAPFKYAVLEHWDQLANYAKGFLDALDGIVREGDREDVFFPSAHIPKLQARASKLTGASPNGVDNRLVERWLRLEGAWLFLEELENLTPEALHREYGVEASRPWKAREGGRAGGTSRAFPGPIEAAREALRALVRAASHPDIGIAPPFPYLAVLAADGDRMGAWISGTGGEGVGRAFEVTREYQAALSEALRDFALHEVPKHIHDEALGRLVYAGGDDVLALLPVRGMLPAVSGLEEAYAERLTHAMQEQGRDQGEPLPTMSAALFVAHRKHPFSHMVEEVQSLLKDVAKEQAGRDALAVAVSVRAGGERTVVAKWGGEADGQRFPDALSGLVETFREGDLARGLPHALDELEPALGRWHGPSPGPGALAALQRGEVARLVIRRSKNAQVAASSNGRIWTLLKAFRGAPLQGRRNLTAWSRLVEGLSVAEFVARAGRLA